MYFLRFEEKIIGIHFEEEISRRLHNLVIFEYWPQAIKKVN